MNKAFWWSGRFWMLVAGTVLILVVAFGINQQVNQQLSFQKEMTRVSIAVTPTSNPAAAWQGIQAQYPEYKDLSFEAMQNLVRVTGDNGDIDWPNLLNCLVTPSSQTALMWQKLLGLSEQTVKTYPATTYVAITDYVKKTTKSLDAGTDRKMVMYQMLQQVLGTNDKNTRSIVEKMETELVSSQR